MGMGFVVFDVLYLLFAALLYGGAAWAASRVWLLSEPILSPWGAAPLAVLAFLLALIFEVGVIARLCPPLRPGRYRMMKHPVFYSWAVRMILRRVLWFPPLKVVLFNVNVLRFLSLRAMQAQVAFTASVSNDVEILDPALVSLGAGSVCGARVFICPHLTMGENLVLGRVEIGQGALLGNGIFVALDVVVEQDAQVLPLSSLGIGARVGRKARVGPATTLEGAVIVGENARVGSGQHIKGGQIAAGARYPGARGAAKEPKDASA